MYKSTADSTDGHQSNAVDKKEASSRLGTTLQKILPFGLPQKTTKRPLLVDHSTEGHTSSVAPRLPVPFLSTHSHLGPIVAIVSMKQPSRANWRILTFEAPFAGDPRFGAPTWVSALPRLHSPGSSTTDCTPTGMIMCQYWAHIFYGQFDYCSAFNGSSAAETHLLQCLPFAIAHICTFL